MSIYYRGNVVTPTLAVPNDIYENIASSTASITLDEVTTIYSIKPIDEITISINTANLRFVDTKCVSFKVIIDLTDGVQTINWPSTVVWDTTPTLNDTKVYMLSFIKLPNSNNFIGKQLLSWE